MNDIFKIRENTHYNLRHTSQFLVNPIHIVFNGSESASYLGPKIWEETPTETHTSKIKTLSSDLKKKSKSGNP